MGLSLEVGRLGGLLKRRLEVIADREWFRSNPEGHLEALAAVSEEIDRSSAVVMGEEGIPSTLKHYLAKRSFEKALVFIESGGASDETFGEH
jgi:hypothetical protein